MLSTVTRTFLVGAALIALSVISASLPSTAQPTAADYCMDKFQYQRDMQGLTNNLTAAFENLNGRLTTIEKKLAN